MKNIKILTESKKIKFEVTGSYYDLEETKKFLKDHPHLFAETGVIWNTKTDGHSMDVTCPESIYQAIIILLNDFISK